MKRIFLFGCIVAELFSLGCGEPPDNTKSTVKIVANRKVLPPQKKPSQPKGQQGGARSKRDVVESNTAASSGKTSAGEVLLTPSDFTFVGSYPFSADNQATFGMGLTHHRVKGQLRFLTVSYEGAVKARLIEFALPEKVGQKIARLTGSWDDIWSPAPHPNLGGGDEYGLWMESLPGGSERLWTTHCNDYPADGTKPGQASCPLAIAVRTLKSDGKISDLAGEYGFEGVGQRAIYGGIQPIPQWFRRKYDIHQPYAVGWGGCAARMAQGLVPSLGLMALAIPDPTTCAANSTIPTKDFKILSDHRSGTMHSRDWYAKGRPTSFDRGRRNADVINYFDGGDKRQNPSSPPSDPPAARAQWQSPAPDGFGRFVWSDSYYNTGCWIDGPKKGGFITIGSFAKGKAFYMSSTLYNSGRHAELQIFDPHHFGEVLQGKKDPWAVQPVASKLLTADLTPLGLLFPNGGNNPSGAIAGATFDAKTGFLYLWCPGVNKKYGCCLVVYKVNC
ncbi:MAG: hypothetical protein ACRELG_12650 [Gemmataceae bacterium]